MSGEQSIAVTGVGRGIGKGIAVAFLDQGWKVYGFGRTIPDELLARGVVFGRCDMADPASVEAACKIVEGALDVLCCNAATFGGGAFNLSDFQPGAFAETFTINTISPIVMARELKPSLEQGRRKLIIMMSTGNASLGGNVEGTMLAYRCSKSALNQASRNLAIEWASAGITTLALNPGWVRTDMGGPNAPLSVEEAAANIYSFVTSVVGPHLNGGFVNTDGSPLPW